MILAQRYNLTYIKGQVYITHYIIIAKAVAEEEKKEGNLYPTNYTHKIQTNKQTQNERTLGCPALRNGMVG